MVNFMDDDGDIMSCENLFGDYDRNLEMYGFSSFLFFCVYLVVFEEFILIGFVGCFGIVGGGLVKVLDDDDGFIGFSEGIVLYRED